MKLRQLKYLPILLAVLFGLTDCTPEQDDDIAPTRQFVKYYGRNGLDVGVDIIYESESNDIVILGQRNAISAAQNSLVLYRMDSAGNELFQEEIGEAGFIYTGRKIIADPFANGFIVGGTLTNTTTLESFMFTLKVGDDLVPISGWDNETGSAFKTYGKDTVIVGGQTRTTNHRLFDLKAHEDGLVIIGTTNDVETNKVGFNPATDATDVSVYLLDQTGDVVLSKIYGYPGTDQGHSIIPTGNGTYAIMGVTSRSAFGGDDTQLGGANILFNMIDSQGQLLQSKVYGSTSGDGNVNVNDAPIVMVQDGLGFTGMANDGTSNAIMIRLTSTGELIALNNLNLSISGQNSISTSLIRTFRGSYIITGSVNTRADDVTLVDRGTDMLVMNINQDFTVNTERVYNYGGEENDVSNGIIQLPSSNLMILGTTDFENGNTMITLMKTNATGRLISN